MHIECRYLHRRTLSATNYVNTLQESTDWFVSMISFASTKHPFVTIKHAQSWPVTLRTDLPL